MSWVRALALVLACLLALSIYGNYRTGRDLQRLCELIGPHDVGVAVPRTPREEIDNICIDHEPEDHERGD